MTNDKLMLALLTNLFGEKAQHLLEICNATQQPTVALEMLAGLYEQPELGANVRHVKSHYNNFAATSTGFNALASEQVSYVSQRTTTLYFATQELAEKFGRDGNAYNVKSSKEANHDHSFAGIHTEQVKGCCSLNTWLEYAPVAEALPEPVAQLVDVLC